MEEISSLLQGFAIVMEVFNLLDVYQGGAGRHSWDTTIDQFVLRWRVRNRIFNLWNQILT
jgi:hypothetical protein